METASLENNLEETLGETLAETAGENWQEKWLAWTLAMLVLVGKEYSVKIDQSLKAGLTAWHELGHVFGAVGTGGWVETLSIAGPMDGDTVMMGGWALGARWMGYGGMILWSLGVWYWSHKKPGRMLWWGVGMAWIAALAFAREEQSVVVLLWLAAPSGAWLVLAGARGRRVMERTLAWIVMIWILTEMLTSTQLGVPLDALKLEAITGISTQTWMLSWGLGAMGGIIWGCKELVSLTEEEGAEIISYFRTVLTWTKGQVSALADFLAY